MFQIILSTTSTIVADLEEGKYKWRVFPITKNNKFGQSSDWSFFSVTHLPINAENIMGIEKDAVTTRLSTSLTYPQAAIKGPDGFLYISDTHSNVIR